LASQALSEAFNGVNKRKCLRFHCSGGFSGEKPAVLRWMAGFLIPPCTQEKRPFDREWGAVKRERDQAFQSCTQEKRPFD